MSNILLLLQTVHTLTIKKSFSEPKIYTGGVDVLLWNQLSKEDQINALSKDWYIYYKFLNKRY
jgi:hypothetical protein